ncbi:MAG: hypothetical protein ABSD85_12865 [Acidimicrobiales bacterium]
MAASGAFATSLNGFHSARPLRFSARPRFVFLGVVAIIIGVPELRWPSSSRYRGDAVVGTRLVALGASCSGGGPSATIPS